MSLSTTSSTGYPYAAVNSGSAGGSGVLRAIEDVPGKIADGVEDVGGAVEDAASATVSFSERAMQALANGGVAVVHGVEDAIEFPFELVGDVAMAAAHAVEGGIHLVSSGISAVVGGLESAAQGAATAVHAVAVDLPEAIATDVTDVTQAALGDAGTVATAAAGVTLLTGSSPISMIKSVI